MQVVLNTLAFHLLFPVLVFLRTWCRARTGSRKYGCSDPPKRPAFDFVLGIDNEWEDIKAHAISSVLVAEEQLHRQLGNTWCETTTLGSNFHTAVEENIRAILGTNPADWGVQPFRFDSIKPFCGSGALTTGGASYLPQFEHSLAVLLKQLPIDSSTVDFQQAILLMFVDTTTNFILGDSLGPLDGSLDMQQ